MKTAMTYFKNTDLNNVLVYLKVRRKSKSYSMDMKKVVLLISIPVRVLISVRITSFRCLNHITYPPKTYHFANCTIPLSYLITSLRWLNDITSVTAAYHFVSTLLKESSDQ
jgi:hypothetical protein